MELNHDPEWLRKRAEEEDGCIISVGGLVATIQTKEQAGREALAFLRRLATSDENGAVVSSQACSVMEITFARAEGRFWVDPETSCGYVLRTKGWRELAEQSISASGAAEQGKYEDK